MLDETVIVRQARADDVDAILALLARDAILEVPVELGPPTPKYYREAFERIDADPSELLAVAERNCAVIGTLQMSIIPYLMWRGGRVAQIEFLRVATDLRGEGIGERMMRWAIDTARSRGCVRVQLDTNNSRLDAHRFYLRLGFQPTHIGMRIYLGPADEGDDQAIGLAGEVPGQGGVL